MDPNKKKWTIVAFNHPSRGRSVLYRQNLDVDGLLRAVDDATQNGANLMSIRGVEDGGEKEAAQS